MFPLSLTLLSNMLRDNFWAYQRSDYKTNKTNNMELAQIQEILSTIKVAPFGVEGKFSAEESEGGFKLRLTIGDYASKGYWIPKSTGFNDVVLQTWKITNDLMGTILKATYSIKGVSIWTYKKPSPEELIKMGQSGFLKEL